MSDIISYADNERHKVVESLQRLQNRLNAIEFCSGEFQNAILDMKTHVAQAKRVVDGWSEIVEEDKKAS